MDERVQRQRLQRKVRHLWLRKQQRVNTLQHLELARLHKDGQFDVITASVHTNLNAWVMRVSYSDQPFDWLFELE